MDASAHATWLVCTGGTRLYVLSLDWGKDVGEKIHKRHTPFPVFKTWEKYWFEGSDGKILVGFAN